MNEKTDEQMGFMSPDDQKSGNDRNESTVPAGGVIPMPTPGPYSGDDVKPSKPFKITQG